MNKIRIMLCALVMLVCVLPVAASGTLANSTDFTWDCPGGGLRVNFSFVLPTKSADGATDYTGQDMTWQLEVNKKTVLLSDTAKAGEKIDTSYTFDTERRYWIDVRATAPDGKRSVTDMSIYVGAGRPAAPQNVLLSIDDDGNVSLTWDTPTSTLDDKSYVDYDSIYYDITRYPGQTVVAQDLKANSFTEKLDFGEYAMYYYTVKPRFRTHVGSKSGTSNKVGYGRGLSVPWLEDFTADNFNNLWTNIDGNGDDRKWFNSSGSANSSSAYGDRDGNDFLVGPAIYLETGQVYDFSVRGRNAYAYQKSRLEVLLAEYSDTATFAVAAQKLLTADIGTDVNALYACRMTVPETRNYYVVLHSASPQECGSYEMRIDSVCITLVGSLQAPDTVTALDVTPAAKAGMSAAISFCAPTVALNGSKLTSLTKIDVLRADSVLVQSISSPQPGVKLTVTDSTPVRGFNTWTVAAYNDAGIGDTAHVTAYVGLDVPQPVRNIHMQDQYDGTALLTWDTPDTTGVNGGYVAVDTLVYTVYSSEADSALVSGISGRSYALTGLATTGDQGIVTCRVTATNDAGTSEPAYANSIVTGAMTTLPYKNGFTSDDYSSRMLYEKAEGVEGYTNPWYWLTVASGDGDSQCITWFPSNAGDASTLYTEKISLEGATHPVVRYCYMEDPQRNEYSWLKVVRSSTDEIVLDSLNYNEMNSTPRTWHRHGFDITELVKGQKYIQLAIKCKSYEEDLEDLGMPFDALEVFDALDYDLHAEKISTTEAYTTGKMSQVKVTVTNVGYKNNDKYTVNLLVNGEKVDSQPGVALPLFDSHEFVFNFTPLTLREDSCTVQAVVDYMYDSNEDNNATEILTVPVHRSPYTAVTTLTATGTSHVTLKWNKPTVDDVQAVTDDFEQYEPWQLGGIDKWTVIDGDQKETTKPTSDFYPNRGEPQAWMVQNNNQFVSLLNEDDILSPHSGQQVAVSMSNLDKSANDDWIITPILSGRRQVFSAYLKCFGGTYFTNTVQILTSATDTLRESFTCIDTQTLSENKWYEISDTIPEGTKYVAIRNISIFKFYLYLDDVTYEPGCGDVLNYQIYEDGKLIDTVSDTTYSYAPADSKQHSYQVSVTYTEGVSSLSNIATAGGLEGDINRDGVLNVSDVTSLVNMVLELATPDASAADVNGDGEVNTTDVAAEINLILASPVYDPAYRAAIEE